MTRSVHVKGKTMMGLLALSLTLGLAACNEGPFEEAGENLDEAVDDTGDALDDLGDDIDRQF